jgi:hypothetical protein
MRAAESELHDRVAFSCQTDARSFGSDQCLKINEVQESRLEKLAFKQRPSDPQQRLVREHNIPFRNRIDVASESKRLKVIQKFRFENLFPIVTAQLCKVGEVIRLKREVLEVIDRIAQPAGDCVTALERLVTKREMKNRLVIKHLVFPVTERHCELVKVRQERRRHSIFRCHL